MRTSAAALREESSIRLIHFLRGLFCGAALLLLPITVEAQIQLSPVVSDLSNPVFVGTNLDSCANPENYISPVLDYSHSNGRCSVIGGYLYRGLQNVVASGTYIYGDYCSGEIFAWNGSSQSVLLDTAMNISPFGEDEQGSCTLSIWPAR